MKKYIQLEMYVLTLNEQDVITTSGFWGGEDNNDGFGPNPAPNPTNFQG